MQAVYMPALRMGLSPLLKKTWETALAMSPANAVYLLT